MQNSVSKCFEGPDAEADTLEYLCLVVVALCEAVRVRDIKTIENVL